MYKFFCKQASKMSLLTDEELRKTLEEMGYGMEDEYFEPLREGELVVGHISCRDSGDACQGRLGVRLHRFRIQRRLCHSRGSTQQLCPLQRRSIQQTKCLFSPTGMDCSFQTTFLTEAERTIKDSYDCLGRVYRHIFELAPVSFPSLDQCLG